MSGEPGVSPQGSRRRSPLLVATVLGVVVAGALVAVVLLAGRLLSGAVGAGTRDAGARDAALAYAQAFADGDAAALRDALGFEGEWPATLDQVSLDAQREQAPVTDVELDADGVAGDDPAERIYRLTYTAGGQGVADEVWVRRTSGWPGWPGWPSWPGRTWEVSSALPTVTVTAPAHAASLRLNATNLLADGTAGGVPGQVTVPVFPGGSSMTPDPVPGRTATGWSGVLVLGDDATADVGVALDPAAEPAVRSAVQRWLDACSATPFTNPGGCPLAVSDLPGEEQSDVAWTYAPSSLSSAQVGVEDDGAVVATGTATGEVTFTDLVRADSSAALVSVPGERSVQAPYRVEVAVGLDGSAEVVRP